MKNKSLHSTTIRFFIRSLLINSLLLLIPLLLIGLYSILRTTRESTEEAGKKAVSILNQADDIMESFYSHVDNAFLFFSSNPRVTLQLKKAFEEPTLSLESIKSAENLSLNFQNLIYTDSFIQNIYIYYKNDYNRIFVPLNSRILSFPPENEEKIRSSYSHAGKEDVWMEFSRDALLYSDYNTSNLLIYRKLYRRTTDIQNGLVIFGFDAGKLEQEMNRLMEYTGQKIYLVRADEGLIWPSEAEYSARLLALADQLVSDSAYGQNPGSETRACDYETYTATVLKSPRSYGFSYLLLTPKSEIYKSTISLTGMYIMITLISIAVACMIAFIKTRHDYKYLGKIIGIFSTPGTAVKNIDPPEKRSSNPFEYITFNVIRLFLEQDYLKIQDSEKAAKLQLSKMRALQHQINPHFLHNTLNNIYWESVKLTGSENKCSQMISHLSAIMRYSLSDPQETVTIQDEISYLKKYLEIMKLRYPGRFRIRFCVQPDCLKVAIKKMLLQPLVENSIYHGIKEKKEPGLIQISIRRKRDRIYITLYDSGNGISPEKLYAIRQSLEQTEQEPVSDRHIGLTNTNSRLLLSYGKESRLHINSVTGEKNSFTVIWFSVPIS